MPILALSAWFQKSQIFSMLAAEANGYCLKNIGWQQLLAVICLIRGGGICLDPQVAQKLPSVLKLKTSSVDAPIPEAK
ncbi:MAG: DNA-binding response regulator, partial [Cyanobacteria bacterium J06636_16]